MSKIHVVSTGRNPSKAIFNCVESVQRQTLQPESHTLIDDISDDGTPDLLDKISNKNISYLTIIQNTERQYRLKNIYDNSINKDLEDIICVVDTDDWIANKDVLSEINETYKSDSKLEYVYTNFRCSCESAPGEGKGPSSTVDRTIPSKDWNPYKEEWITSHMCTFKVKALKRIPIANFLDWDNNWFKMGTDHALAMPLLTALKRRDGDYSAVKHINKASYVYHWASRDRGQATGYDPLADEANNCATFIRYRGYVD